MHQHYKIDHLTFETKLELIRECKIYAFKTWCDMLDCDKSYSRIESDKDFDEIIEILTSNDYLSFVSRDVAMFNEDNYLEVCFNTIRIGVDYFIWTYIDLKHIDYFKDKYNINNIIGEN